ncbi:MAG: hypothetical protein ACYS47_03290 [Planctomycetota bacterium]|jgi:hypothetical protein
MVEKIQATCGGCGRSFEFLPDKAKDKCLYCGSPLNFPEGFELPAPAPAKAKTAVKQGTTARRGLIAGNCPVCNRTKKYDGALAGRFKLCLFCSAPLLVPMEDGPATFSWKEEEPALELTLPEVVTKSVASHSRLTVNILEKLSDKGKLGGKTAAWVVGGLEKVRQWEQAKIAKDSPLDMAFTAEVLRAAVFHGRNTTEIREGPASMRLRIEIGSIRGIDPAISALLSPGVNLGPKGGTRVMGLGGSRADREGAGGGETLIYLNVHMTEDERGTDFTYSLEDSEGDLIKSGEVMSHEFLASLPDRLARGARSLIALRAVYGVELPGHVLPFVSEEGLSGHLERLTGEPEFATQIAQALARLVKS